jgi:hypothetical protein
MNGSPLDRWFPELLADLARRKPQAPKKSIYAANPLNFEVLKKRDLPSRGCAPVPCDAGHHDVPCGDNDCRGVLDHDRGSHGCGSNKGSHKGSGKGSACKGSHKGSGKGSHKGSGKGSHKGSNKGSCKGSHKGSNKGSHKGSNKGSHKGSNKGSCKGSHKGSNKGSHKGSKKGSHKGSRKGSGCKLSGLKRLARCGC